MAVDKSVFFVFQILPFEPELCLHIPESFFQAYPFFRTPLAPKANAYLINRLVRGAGIHILRQEDFRIRFEPFARDLAKTMTGISPQAKDAPYTHRLDMDGPFLDFLRLSAGIKRIGMADALELKRKADEGLERFSL